MTPSSSPNTPFSLLLFLHHSGTTKPSASPSKALVALIRALDPPSDLRSSPFSLPSTSPSRTFSPTSPSVPLFLSLSSPGLHSIPVTYCFHSRGNSLLASSRHNRPLFILTDVWAELQQINPRIAGPKRIEVGSPIRRLNSPRHGKRPLSPIHMPLPRLSDSSQSSRFSEPALPLERVWTPKQAGKPEKLEKPEPMDEVEKALEKLEKRG